MRRVWPLAILLGVAFGSGASAEPAKAFGEWLESERAQWAVPGVSVAVIKDFGVAWAAGYGLADVARAIPVTTETLFQAASVSKPATAVATMIALDRHALSVEDDVNGIFDRFPPPAPAQDWRLLDPYPVKVSVRMLLSHTGGTNAFHYSGYRFAYDTAAPHSIDPLPSLADELFGRPPSNTPSVAVERPPGQTWVYSPAGYTALQAMLAGVEGEPFADVMDDLLLKPLGLAAGAFEQPAPPPRYARMATPYIAGDTPLADGPRVFIAAASGGWTATPTDVARLLIAVQKALAGAPQGGITPEIARAMMVRQPGVTPKDKCFPAAEPGEQACRTSWGLGFDVNLTKTFEHEADDRPTGAWFGHSGFNSGYLTLAVASKTGGKGAVIMANVAPEDMSGDVPQWPFMMKVVKRIAEEENW
jgi:CubicO group peptidase (beta-lactamase class C family)